MDTLPDWLTNEAISNYIVGIIIGIFIPLGLWFLRTTVFRPAPSVIRVVRFSESSLLDIAPDAHDRVQIVFQSQPVTTLHQLVLVITNSADKPIENVVITCRFRRATATEPYELALDDPLENIRPQPSIGQTANGEIVAIQLTIPYLNPKKDHGDQLKLVVYSPSPISVEGVVGGGVGWSTRYFDRVAVVERIQLQFTESSSLIESISISVLGLVRLRFNL